jgi:divalent metal cation (Fe/Co/Zn/Cd) transporter
MLSGAGAVLALVTLLAIVVDNAFGWWWSDAVAAILIAAFLAREGVQALRGEE